MLHQARLPGHQPRNSPAGTWRATRPASCPGAPGPGCSCGTAPPAGPAPAPGLLQLGAGVGVLQLQLVLLDGEQLLPGPPPLGCPHCHSSLHLNVYCVCDVCNAIVYSCIV